jgi:hypothetical protein
VNGNPWIRPYLLTGGRTQTRHQLFLHTLVSVGREDPAASSGLTPEAGRLYERARLGTQSLAELSAHCGMPLGVTRVLLEDLAAAGRVQISAGRSGAAGDQGLLQRVLDGLRQIA